MPDPHWVSISFDYTVSRIPELAIAGIFNKGLDRLLFLDFFEGVFPIEIGQFQHMFIVITFFFDEK